MDSTTPLVKKLSLTGEELIAALSGPNFYIELLCISLSLALALLVAVLIRKRTALHFKKHPPKKIDVEFITKPLILLGPLLAIIYLAVAESLVREYTGGAWIEATIQLSMAYLLARSALLVIEFKPVAYFIAIVIMSVAVLDVTGFMKSVSTSLEGMAFQIGTFKISMLELIHGLIILVIVFWMAGLLSRTLESYLRRSSSLSYSARELTVKFFRIFIYFAALLITLSSMGVDLTAFAVFGGALGVGIGLGLQRITANFVSGITLLLEKSIKLGDLIEIGDLVGWVRQLNIRYTLLETADGRELLIPNEELISTRVMTWTHSNEKARIEITVSVAYDSDAKQVQKLLMEAATEYSKCLKYPEPKCWLREFGDSGLKFLLAFWIENVKDEGRMGPQSEVMFSVIEKFKSNGIKIPSPQREVRVIHGKDPYLAPETD